MTYKNIRVTLLFFSFATVASAQTITSKVVDKKTNEPIPYATIQLSENQGIITNEEGRFNVTLENNESQPDSIYISSMGYEKVGIAVHQPTDSIIYLAPKAIELNSVYVSNKNLTIDEIIENVKNRLDQNYNFGLSQKRLFFRESEFNTIKKLHVDFKKSTIEELNKQLIDSVVSIIPRKSQYYTETLCDLYGDFEKRKLHIIKAAELYDKNNEVSMEAMSKRMEDIFMKNVKPDSYLKIKSGIFGTKVQVDSILENNSEATAVKDEIKDNKEDKSDFLKHRKSGLKTLMSSLFFNEDVMSNFLNKSNRYAFELVDYTSIDDYSVYIINFSPKRKEDFKGTLYVNTEDFAVVRVDYQNVRNLKNFKLLGLQYQDNLYKAKMLFNKGANQKYDLKYLEMYRGSYFGVDRPLKVIEKNKHVKGPRKQNELSLDIDAGFNTVSKYEIVVFNSKQLSETDYKNSKENKSIKPQYLSQYDPQFWQGYTIIEPNAAIRQFTVAPETE
ncbi:carboxypeptidase-like regulatory domain-containing protein [Aquimarina sp. U1-2]|uniref:carboxypeptidase-like regulatory domain-containing protein n=1 Tax=Aquimarina sp. U1-2 TaxID=2823141 RepID=UPI001AEC83F6|nr:carboxypeptidase-like regulatory domain-containing protein [Aquimarina sp. U1-2]MBP2834138.1 carboxypeptidase-like regulatory domain-containing protein [Aquimarina sp. U1-2]